MIRVLIAPLILAVALLAGACADDGDATAGGGGEDQCSDPEFTTLEDCTGAGHTWGSDSSGDGGEVTCTEPASCAGGTPTSYPNGPFASDDDPVGDKIDNHSFTTPEGDPLSFGDLRSAGGKTLLLVSTTAGWCTACIEEQPKLESFYHQYGCDGLEVMVAIFEDIQFNPAQAAQAKQWQQQYGLSFPVVADTDNVLSTYYDSGAAPLNMLIDLCTMEVLYSGIGFDETAVTATIESHLGL
ncbi:MAG: TlpA disulfide reductase family protein [Myxococcota bacterium]|nr:TlpA disulfide reductase family protein [Myxococcota bacterium]